MSEISSSTLRDANIWINAWYDPLAGVSSFSSCIALSDINGDGDFKLITATSNKNPLDIKKTKGNSKLRVYKGTGIINESVLLEEPIGIVSFYSDYSSPRRPTIAVASGSSLYLYKNLQPYYKLTLPAKFVDNVEKEIWNNLKEGKYDVKTGYLELTKLRDKKVNLTNRSYELLGLSTGDEIKSFIESRKGFPLEVLDTITCVTVLNKDREGFDSISCPVVGVETGLVYILDSRGSQILKAVELPSAPVKLVTAGTLDQDYRIIAACRNGNVYTIKNAEVSGVVIELESHPVSIVRIEKNVLVGLMNNTIHCFQTRGKKLYSIYLPSPIKEMEVLSMSGQRNVKCLIVALENKELRVYNDKFLINTISLNEPVLGMRFGIYGTEPNTLVLSYRNGGLDFRMVSRKAILETKGKGGPPSEQEEPLDLPQRTFLYLEQTKREVEYATEMHTVFQKDLARMRLNTAKAYVKILTDGQGPLSYTSGSSIRLTAQVQGLGPHFKINIEVQNTGKKPIPNLFLLFGFDENVYTMESTKITLAPILPGITYRYSSMVTMPETTLSPDDVRIFVCSRDSTSPIITAVVKMPAPELTEV
ncbi:hypothetical protein ABK040_012946 [Willaertia magna]